MLQKEVEVISLSDIPRDQDFVRNAGSANFTEPRHLLAVPQNLSSKEDAVEENIALCAKGLPSSIFIDTKEQNGCARVGQTKLFARNYSIFAKNVGCLRKRWYENILDFCRERKEVDLHMQMISTVAGAEDLFSGAEGEYKHSDELWIWIPFTEQSIEHLKGFLNAFSASPQIAKKRTLSGILWR